MARVVRMNHQRHSGEYFRTTMDLIQLAGTYVLADKSHGCHTEGKLGIMAKASTG